MHDSRKIIVHSVELFLGGQGRRKVVESYKIVLKLCLFRALSVHLL